MKHVGWYCVLAKCALLLKLKVRQSLMVLPVITGLTEVEFRTPTYETLCYKIWVLVSKLGDTIKSKEVLHFFVWTSSESVANCSAKIRPYIGNCTKFYNLQNYNKFDKYIGTIYIGKLVK
jgi:hypothetical protein